MGLGLRTTGRAAKEVSFEIERTITEDDIASLRGERGTKPAELGALRERHHALARLIAEGHKPSEAALMCRFAPARVSVLLGDPTFQELVSHYAAIVNEQFVDFQKQLAQLGVDAATLLQERLEDTPDEISTPALMQLVTISADRTGHGPSQKSEVNIKIGLADRLRAARERSIRDITPREENE